MNDTKQLIEARVLADRAQAVLDRALPRGVAYVVLLSGAGFGTYAANIDKRETLAALQGLVQALQSELISFKE